MSKSTVRIINGRLYYRGSFVCPHHRSLCSFCFRDFVNVYQELFNTGQLDQPLWVDRYYLYFKHEYPVDKVEYDNIAICKECWKDFLMYRLAREGV